MSLIATVGTHTVRSRYAHGTVTVRTRYRHGTHTVPSRYAHGTITVRSQYAHGTLTVQSPSGQLFVSDAAVHLLPLTATLWSGAPRREWLLRKKMWPQVMRLPPYRCWFQCLYMCRAKWTAVEYRESLQCQYGISVSRCDLICNWAWAYR
jgi:hypothetical protein